MWIKKTIQYMIQYNPSIFNMMDFILYFFLVEYHYTTFLNKKMFSFSQNQIKCAEDYGLELLRKRYVALFTEKCITISLERENVAAIVAAIDCNNNNNDMKLSLENLQETIIYSKDFKFSDCTFSNYPGMNYSGIILSSIGVQTSFTLIEYSSDEKSLMGLILPKQIDVFFYWLLHQTRKFNDAGFKYNIQLIFSIIQLSEKVNELNGIYSIHCRLIPVNIHIGIGTNKLVIKPQ